MEVLTAIIITFCKCNISELREKPIVTSALVCVLLAKVGRATWSTFHHIIKCYLHNFYAVNLIIWISFPRDPVIT